MGKTDKKVKKSLSVTTKEVKEVEIKPLEEVLKTPLEEVEKKPLVEGEKNPPVEGEKKKKKKKRAKKGDKENAKWSKHTTITPDAAAEPVVEAEKSKPAPPKEVKTIKKHKIDDCVKAFSKLIATKVKDEDNKLFEDGPKKISLQVAAIKLAADADKYILKARMVNNPNVPDTDVLLIVKDIERGIKADHEATLLHYKTLLEKAGVDNIAEIMPMRQLRVEYKEFEAKKNLCNRFDKVLVDDRIIRLIPQFLGGVFYKKNKMPVQVSLTKKNLKQEITRCINTTLMPLKNHGADSSILIGHTLMKSAELSDNCETAIKAMEERFPGGWVNVRSVHLRVENASLPLYVTDRKTSEVGKVQTVNVNRNKRPTVVDELSTIPGATVSVNIAGGIKVKRVADPEWDAKVEGPWGPGGHKKMKAGDKAAEGPADTEDTEDMEDVEDKPPRKETKKEKKEKKAAEEVGKKKKGSKNEDPEESEDDMDDMEQDYMRKVAEEEEEIERKEKENMEKMGIPAAKDEDDEDDLEDEEDEESLADDDVEAENLLSDDDQEDGGDNIIMNRPDEDEADEREEHLKKKSQNKKGGKKQKSAEKETSGKKKKGKKPEEKKGKDSNKVKGGKIQKKKKN